MRAGYAPATVHMDYEILDAIYAIPQPEIMVDPGFNCRGAFTPQSVHGLSQSIRENGLLEPLIVQPIADISDAERPESDALYRIIAGHRREAAIRLFLRWEKLPCRIVKGLAAEQAQILNFVENLDREDLNMLEEAEALERVWSDLSERQLAKRIKRHARWIRARRRLLRLPEEVKQAAASGRLSQYDVEFIGRATNADDQIRLYNNILEAKKNPDRKVRFRGAHYRKPSTRNRRQIEIMVSYLMEHVPDAEQVASALAWAAGHLETQAFIEERLGLPFNKELFDD